MTERPIRRERALRSEGRPQRPVPGARPEADQAPRAGDVRVAPLLPLPGLLREFGVDPSEVFRAVGFDPRLFDDIERRVDFRTVGELLRHCADRTGCPHFGLLLGERLTIESTGMLSQLLQNAPTLRDALRTAAIHIGVNDRGAVALTLRLDETDVALGYALLDGNLPGAEQILDGAIALQFTMLRTLCGPTWKPRAVQLSRRRPADVRPYRYHFGTQVEFDAPLSANVFPARWLDHPIEGANPDVFRSALAMAAQFESTHWSPFSEEVRRAIYSLTITGAANETSLARLFGLHERTLRRRLRDERTSLHDLLTHVRNEWSMHLLRDTALQVSEIAWILGYSESTVFSRAFRRWTGASPSAWRERHRRVA